MLKNDKEWEWKINRVMLFGLTALVFTSCFALSGTAFLSFLLVSSYYLLLLIPVELCKYSRTSWRHYKMSMLVAWTCVSFSFAWAETVLVQSLQESAQWVFELKKKRKKSQWESSQLTHQLFYWIYMEMNHPSTYTSSVSFPCLLYTPNIHLTLTKRKCLSSQALINMARHFPFTCIGSTNLNIF